MCQNTLSRIAAFGVLRFDVQITQGAKSGRENENAPGSTSGLLLMAKARKKTREASSGISSQEIHWNVVDGPELHRIPSLLNS